MLFTSKNFVFSDLKQKKRFLQKMVGALSPPVSMALYMAVRPPSVYGSMCKVCLCPLVSMAPAPAPAPVSTALYIDK